MTLVFEEICKTVILLTALVFICQDAQQYICELDIGNNMFLYAIMRISISVDSLPNSIRCLIFPQTPLYKVPHISFCNTKNP
jgi:hypothetical protein